MLTKRRQRVGNKWVVVGSGRESFVPLSFTTCGSR